ncbi:MAG: hypothetical protein MI746_08270 [Pseudomonadales bacterium]|nr:hypothetical protein [Pseudomonadales bacterium]
MRFKESRLPLTICALTFWLSSSAQEDWPHHRADWNDPLFQARVQGVYDWIGSRPDRLETNEFTPIPIPFYQLGTINRDLESFPPRPKIDPEARNFFEPKDWMDRRFLISYMENNEDIEEGYFEDNLDEDAVADTYYLMGNIYFLQSEYGLAIDSYDRAIAEFQNFRLAHKNKAYALALTGDCPGALDAAHDAVRLGAFSVHIKNVQAYCAFEAGDWTTAAESAALSRLLDQSNRQVLLIQIRSLAKLSKFQHALSLANQIENESEASRLKLEILIAEQRAEGSEEELLALLEIKSRFGELTAAEQSSLTGLKISAGIASSIGDEELRSFFDSNTESTQYLEFALKSKLHADGLNTAASFGESVVTPLVRRSDSLDYSSARIVVADIEHQLGKLESAEEILEQLIAEDPLNCQALLLLSETEYKLGKMLESDSHSERAISSARSCDNTTLERRAMLNIEKEEFGLAVSLMLRDWNQKLARGEIPDELYVRKFRAMSDVAQRTGE